MRKGRRAPGNFEQEFTRVPDPLNGIASIGKKKKEHRSRDAATELEKNAL